MKTLLTALIAPRTAVASRSRVLTPVLLALLLLIGGGVALAGQGDWWMFRNNPRHTGRSSFSGPATNTRKWWFDTGQGIYSSPAFDADGTVYFGTNGPMFYALKKDGTLKWSATTASTIDSSPAIGADGTIYVGARDNNLYAFNPNGTKKWTLYVGSMIAESSPVVAPDGTIYVGASNGYLYAVTPNGQRKWVFITGQYILSSPALGIDGTIYVGSVDGKLYAINPDGSKRWAYTTTGPVETSPAIGADGTIYFASHNGKAYAVAPDGSLKWTFTTGGRIGSSPALGADGTLYLGSDDRKLYALTPYGSQKWAFLTGGAICSSPAVGADGVIYVGSDDKNLYALTPDGKVKWTVVTGNGIRTSPAISPDGVYIGSYDGKLYAIGAATPPTVIVTPSAASTGTIDPSSPQVVAVGSSLTFTAAANAGFTVDSWALDNAPAQTGGTQYTLKNLTANHAVNVTFKPLPTYTITPSAGGNGIITPNTPQIVKRAANLTLTATANAGYTVDSWYLDNAFAQTGGGQYTLSNIVTNHGVKVTFKALPTYTIVPSVGPGGTMTPATSQIVVRGANLTFTAAANAGYTVDSWYLDYAFVQSGGTKYTLNNITANHALKVTFKALPSYFVSPSTGLNGTINPNTTQVIIQGANLTLTAAANAGYTVDSWYLDATLAQAGGTQYTLNNITANHAVKVTFKILRMVIVTPTAGPNGTISPATAQTVIVGASLSFTAAANAGYTVESWTCNSAVMQTGGKQYTLSNITTACAVKVTFKQVILYTVTPTAGVNGTISPATAQTVTSGSNLTFTATANAGYTTDSWSLDGSVVQTGGTQYVLSHITANHALTVTFKLYASYQPDLAICNDGETGYTGFGILNLTGANQTKSQTVAAYATGTYNFQVKNAGHLADSVILTCSSVDVGWHVQFIDCATGNDVTAVFVGQSGCRTATLSAGSVAGYILHLIPYANAKPLTLALTASSVGDTTKKDVVKVVTTKQ